AHAATGGRECGGKDRDGGRFARAIWSQQREECARLDPEGDAINGVRRRAAIALDEPLDLDDCWHVSPCFPLLPPAAHADTSPYPHQFLADDSTPEVCDTLPIRGVPMRWRTPLAWLLQFAMMPRAAHSAWWMDTVG